jgi:hypothetical protein
MKNQFIKLGVLIGFFTLFVGSALFMYVKFIHNKPKIKIIAPKTEVDPIKFDSLLYEKNKNKQLPQ